MSWLGSATWRDMSKPRASRSGDSSSKSHRARRALMVDDRVGVDHLRGRHHRVGGGLALHRDAVLDLGAHDPPYAHGTSLRGRAEDVRRDGHLERPGRAAPGGRVAAQPRGRGARERGSAPGCRARSLEIGFGSGLNTRFYPPGVTGVSAVEPSDVAWRLSEPRRGRSGVPVDALGPGRPAPRRGDASHDAALVTFSLCTIADPGLALREVRRVVRPGGRLHFLEHGLAPEAGVRRWQRRLEPVRAPVAGGCHLTRDVPAMLAVARVDTPEPGWLEQAYLPGPAVGRARGRSCPWASRDRPEATSSGGQRLRSLLSTARTTTTTMTMMMMISCTHEGSLSLWMVPQGCVPVERVGAQPPGSGPPRLTRRARR